MCIRDSDKGYLRKSVVKDPVRRGNTGDNTPAMIYTEIVPGDKVKITVGPKGFGSENMSQIRMFKPSAGLQGIKDFILEVVAVSYTHLDVYKRQVHMHPDRILFLR